MTLWLPSASLVEHLSAGLIMKIFELFDILVGCVFALACIMFAFFHCWFKAEEPDYVNKLIEEMNQKAANNAAQ